MKRLALALALALLIAACTDDPAKTAPPSTGASSSGASATSSGGAHDGPRFCATPAVTDVICEDFEVAPLVPASWTVVTPAYGDFEAGEDWESEIALQTKPTAIAEHAPGGGVALLRTIQVSTRPNNLVFHMRLRVVDAKKGAAILQLRASSLGDGLTIVVNSGKLSFAVNGNAPTSGASIPVDANWHAVDFSVAQNGTPTLEVDEAVVTPAGALLSPLDVGQMSVEVGSFQTNPFSQVNNDLAVVEVDDVRLGLP